MELGQIPVAIILTPEQLSKLIKKEVKEAMEEKEASKYETMTKEETAKYLGKSPRAIQRYITEGVNGIKLPYRRTGKRALFVRRDVEEFANYL
jgi:excisionase family DNA binding protein